MLKKSKRGCFFVKKFDNSCFVFSAKINKTKRILPLINEAVIPRAMLACTKPIRADKRRRSRSVETRSGFPPVDKAEYSAQTGIHCSSLIKISLHRSVEKLKSRKRYFCLFACLDVFILAIK